MERRLKLQNLLTSIPDVKKVYFQEPTNVAMKYPCVVYDLDDIQTSFADNIPYRRVKRWKITVIDDDPDSLIPDRIAALRSCVFDTKYKADNLHHHVFNMSF